MHACYTILLYTTAVTSPSHSRHLLTITRRSLAINNVHPTHAETIILYIYFILRTRTRSNEIKSPFFNKNNNKKRDNRDDDDPIMI